MISAELVVQLHYNIINYLIQGRYRAVEKERDRLCIRNVQLRGNDPTYYGFLCGSMFHHLSNLRKEDIRSLKRMGIHPSLANQAQMMHDRMNAISMETKLIQQALVGLIQEGDDLQRVRDVIPDNLVSHISLPVVLPPRDMAESLVAKLGPTGANFCLIRKFADDVMVERLLEG